MATSLFNGTCSAFKLVGDNPIATLDGPVYRSDSGPSELDALVADSRAGIGIVGGKRCY
ncbi:MAG: hypothetical protein AAF215_24765 [Cyanobacteria bacterium P01_A01_bin.123]